MGGTALQRQELIDDIAATPKAQAMKQAMRAEMVRVKAEELLLGNIEKAAKKKIVDDKAAEKLADKTERALEKATEKADKAAEKATEKAEREAEKLALMAPALLIKQKKLDNKAAAILAKASKGKAVTPAEQNILDAKVARDLAAQKVLDDKAIKDLAAQRETARLAQVEADKLLEEARLQAEALAQIQAEELAEKQLQAGKATALGNILAKSMAKQKVIRAFNAGKKVNIDAEALRLKERSEALAKFKSGKKANIDAEQIKLPKEIAKEEARVIEENRLKVVAKAEKKQAKIDAAAKADADELEESIKHVMKKMEKTDYKPGNSKSKTNNPEIRAEAARRFDLEKKEAAAKLAAAKVPAPTASAPSGKGFELNNYMGKGFQLNKSSLPYGARMMIERYDNEKKLRKN